MLLPSGRLKIFAGISNREESEDLERPCGLTLLAGGAVFMGTLFLSGSILSLIRPSIHIGTLPILGSMIIIGNNWEEAVWRIFGIFACSGRCQGLETT